MKKGSLVLNELMNRGQTRQVDGTTLQKDDGQALLGGQVRQSATKTADKKDGG